MANPTQCRCSTATHPISRHRSFHCPAPLRPACSLTIKPVSCRPHARSQLRPSPDGALATARFLHEQPLSRSHAPASRSRAPESPFASPQTSLRPEREPCWKYQSMSCPHFDEQSGPIRNAPLRSATARLEATLAHNRRSRRDRDRSNSESQAWRSRGGALMRQRPQMAGPSARTSGVTHPGTVAVSRSSSPEAAIGLGPKW